jgi:hypothetical protein
MKRAMLGVFAVLCLALGACSPQSMIDKLEPKAESATAKAIIDQLRKGDLKAVESRLDARYLTPDIAAKLQEAAAAFPAGENPTSVKTVGVYENIRYTSGKASRQSTTFNLAYEYQFRDAWVVANILLAEQDGKLVIEGLHTRRLTRSLEASHAFTLVRQDATHWLMALLTCAEALFCQYAFVLCLRTPMARHKWLWALFTLVGVTTLRFDWSSGHFAFTPLSAQFLFGVSATATPYGPWILSVSIPLGAIWFLARRRSLRAATTTPPPLPPG